LDRCKDSFDHILFAVLFFPRLGEILGKEVEKKFGVGVGIDMSSDRVSEMRSEFFGIGEVAIVSDANAVRIVGVKRLGFGATTGASSGIATVSDSNIASKFNHMVSEEDIFDESIVFAKMETTHVGGDDASSVLSTVLQDSQTIKEHLIDLYYAMRRVRL